MDSSTGCSPSRVSSFASAAAPVGAKRHDNAGWRWRCCRQRRKSPGSRAGMTTTGFHATHDGPVATVTLDRPQARNAQTPAMWLALADFARSLSADIRIVVLKGEGPSFSAGLDRSIMGEELGSVAALTPEESADRIASYQAGF